MKNTRGPKRSVTAINAPAVPSGKPTAAAVADLLMRLGRSGARLSTGPEGSLVAIPPGRTRQAAPPHLIADVVVRAARARGFLAVVEEAASRDAAAEILSPAGRAALRDVLIAGAGPNVRRDAANGASRTRGAGRKRAEKLAADFGAPPQRPLDRMSLVEQLRARKDSQGQPLLTDAQVAAAQRFAQDFAIGQMQPRVTARWAVDAMPEPRRRSAPGAGVEVAAATAAAQARVRKAMAHLGGEMAGLVLDVCCFEHGLEEIEAARHWPARSARIALRFALTALAMYYGLIVPPRDGVAPIRQWAELDFKPNANAWKTL